MSTGWLITLIILVAWLRMCYNAWKRNRYERWVERNPGDIYMRIHEYRKKHGTLYERTRDFSEASSPEQSSLP